MMYKCIITETLRRKVFITADGRDEAYEKLKLDYENSKIVLDSNDFVDVDFSVEGECDGK